MLKQVTGAGRRDERLDEVVQLIQAKVSDAGSAAQLTAFVKAYFGRVDPEDLAERRCHQPELLDFELFVTGSGGCNHFQKAAGESMSLEEPTDTPSLH